MTLLLIASLNTGGKEKRFLQLCDHLESLHHDYARFVFYEKVSDHGSWLKRMVRVLILYKLLFFAKPKVIHSWSSFMTVLCAPYSLIFGVKLIDSSISTNGGDGAFIYRMLRRSALIAADRIITNSYRAVEVLKISKRVNVVKNGIQIKYRDLPPNIDGKRTIWFVSRMERGKRVDLFAQVSKLLSSEFQNIQFKIVGDGSQLIRLQETYSLYSNLEFIGYDSSWEEKLKYGDIGVLITDSEGTPNVLLEFMSRGVPVVYWNRDSLIDSPVAHGLTGYNVASMKSCRDAISGLILEEEIYFKLHSNTYLHIESNYNLRINFEKYLEIYSD